MAPFLANFLLICSLQLMAFSIYMLYRNEKVFAVRMSMHRYAFEACGRDWQRVVDGLLRHNENEYDVLLHSFKDPVRLVSGPYADDWRAWHTALDGIKA